MRYWLVCNKNTVINLFYLLSVIIICFNLAKRSTFYLLFENVDYAFLFYPAFFWTLIIFCIFSISILIYGLAVDRMILDKKIKLINILNWKLLINEILLNRKLFAAGLFKIVVFLVIKMAITYLLSLLVPFGFKEIMFFQAVVSILCFYPSSTNENTNGKTFSPLSTATFIYLMLFIFLLRFL